VQHEGIVGVDPVGERVVLGREAPRIIDLGTGSGNLVVALARQLKDAQ
jgi:methylase of polypeptide subunit release factors